MNLHLLFLTVDTICLEVQFVIKKNFIVIITYICMISIMMLDITIEVRENKALPLKGRTQAWLGHFWALLETFTFRHI